MEIIRIYFLIMFLKVECLNEFYIVSIGLSIIGVNINGYKNKIKYLKIYYLYNVGCRNIQNRVYLCVYLEKLCFLRGEQIEERFGNYKKRKGLGLLMYRQI